MTLLSQMLQQLRSERDSVDQVIASMKGLVRARQDNATSQTNGRVGRRADNATKASTTTNDDRYSRS